MSDDHPGIYVAFDGEGKHFAYAVRWTMAILTDAKITQKERRREERGQHKVVDSYRAEAIRKGGELRLLTLAAVVRNMSSEKNADLLVENRPCH